MSLKIFTDKNLTKRELVEELYENSDMITRGEKFTFNQLQLVILSGGEVQARNTNYNDKMVESFSPWAYKNADNFYKDLEKLSECDPKSLRDWLNHCD